MLLRRIATVLASVVPVLALAAGGSGASLALVLLTCLAFTAATIALGPPWACAAQAALGVVCR